MSRDVRRWIERTGSELLGWALVLAGIPMLVLPGPGLIVMAAGVALLSRHYAWARRVLTPLHVRAVAAARMSVATVPRILSGIAGGAWLFGLGVVWAWSPTIPEFDVWRFHLGPQLPGARWVVAAGLAVSAAAAWLIIGYSMRRWRDSADDSVGDSAPDRN